MTWCAFSGVEEGLLLEPQPTQITTTTVSYPERAGGILAPLCLVQGKSLSTMSAHESSASQQVRLEGASRARASALLRVIVE